MPPSPIKNEQVLAKAGHMTVLYDHVIQKNTQLMIMIVT